MNRKKGFTLVELLVVISIIGMLSSIVLASLNTARTKAADAARVSNTKSLKTAIELYYSANNTYPQPSSPGAGTAVANLSPFLVPTYIASIPANLQDVGQQYVFGPLPYGYGLHSYTAANGWCVTGADIHPGWWGTPAPLPLCNY